ncbi:lipid-A-disaccharide synthase [Malonomonas rubra]|uniref:lipid-A-disaccharide synthase n=1 Tax=Malonomonas rubra TaxID=57040 RepID=UPI001FCA3E27|nr:lipid-A-disaccharide synthase [Malonomonas rubra]
MKDKKVMIVAGESSGDLHGSNLLKSAAKDYPHLKFFGVGGERMRATGCEIIFPSDDLSVMGLVEVFGQLPRLFARFRQLKQLMQGKQRPDLLVLIDFPDFNLRLAKVAKNLGVPVLYYISPKVWAWRKGRAKIIAERVDRIALIFPFEPEIYRPFGLQADYVGNPLLDEFVANEPEGTLRSQLNVSARDKIVGIFPGSRQSEIKYIFPTLLETARKLAELKPQVKFLLPVAPSLSFEYFDREIAASGLPVTVVNENIYEVAAACDAVLTVSGTVTLQIALAGTPMVILYKVSPLSYEIGRRLINVDHVGLPNIVAGKTVVRELLQNDATPERLCRETIRILDDAAYRQDLLDGLSLVQKKMGEPGCSERVARIVAELVAQRGK